MPHARRKQRRFNRPHQSLALQQRRRRVVPPPPHVHLVKGVGKELADNQPRER